MPLLPCYLLAAARSAGVHITSAVTENCDTVQLLRRLAGESVCCPAGAGRACSLLRTPWKSLPALINVVSALLRDSPVVVLFSR